MNAKHPDRLYKSDRLNYIVNRMRLRQDITPAMLATELHVSERTIYRDLRYLEKGNTLKKRYSRREGRYMLETELQLPPLVLTPFEALALFTASSNPALAKGQFHSEDLRSGLNKLATLLMAETHRETPETKPEFLHGYAIVGEPVNVNANSILRPTLEMIRRAMGSNHKLRFSYWSGASEREEEIIAAPYDVRLDGTNWLLLAQSERAHARIYRIVRMRAVEILPDRFRYPRRFSADALFARAMEAYGKQDDELTVKIRFSARVSDVVLGTRSRQIAAIHRDTDGSVICTLLVNSTKEIVWWILSYGTDAEVIEPQSLRDECCKIAITMVQLYQAASRKETIKA